MWVSYSSILWELVFFLSLYHLFSIQPQLEFIYFTEGTPPENLCVLYFSESKCDPVATLDQWEVDIDQDYPQIAEPAMPEARLTI